MSLLSAVLMLSLAEPLPAAPSADARPKGDSYALLVGVQKYSEAKELRPLPYSERDVTDLAHLLRDSGYKADNIVLMTQTAADDDLRYLPMKQRILKELRLLLADRREDDTVLLAFAGHGVHFSGDKNSYFCPADAQLNDRSTLLAVPDLFAELEKCKAGVKVLLVDACRNDPFKDNTRAAKLDLESVTRPEVPEPPKGVVAFFSCSEKEKAYEDDKLHHGVFFHFVIEGLKGDAAPDKGDVSLLALTEYVTRKVSDHVRASYGQTQRPEAIGSSSGSASVLHLDDAAIAFRNGKAFLDRYQYDEAIEQFSAALERNAKLAASYANRALAYVQRPQFDHAMDDCERALQLDPRLALAYAARGEVFDARIHEDREADYEKAAADCTEAIRLDPGLALAYAFRSEVLVNKKDYEHALADAEQAIALDPSAALGYSYRGYVFRSQGQTEKAIADFSEAIRKDPRYLPALALRGGCHQSNKEYDQAIDDCTKAIQLDPKFATAYSQRGNAWFATKEYDKAIDDYSEAIRLDPKFVSAYSGRGHAWHEKKENDKAINDYSEAIRLNPKFAPAWAGAGNARFQQKDYDKAIDDCTEAIGLDPTISSTWDIRGAAYSFKQQRDQAIRDYSEAIRLDPRNIQAYRNRAMAYKQLGNTENAAADQEMVRRLGGQP